MTSSKRLTLEWDYCAEPLWEGGVNLSLSELEDPEVRKEIRNWYRDFSRAEEVVDEVGSRPHSRAEVKDALIELKRLIPKGKKLAARIGATLKVDYGHDPSFKELEFEVFGEGNDEIETWWKRERMVSKEFDRQTRKLSWHGMATDSAGTRGKTIKVRK